MVLPASAPRAFSSTALKRPNPTEFLKRRPYEPAFCISGTRTTGGATAELEMPNMRQEPHAAAHAFPSGPGGLSGIITEVEHETHIAGRRGRVVVGRRSRRAGRNDLHERL